VASTIFTLALAPMRVAPRRHGLEIRQGANAAGGLDAHLGPHHAAHERHIVRGGARWAETSRSLDEIRTRQFRERAGDGFLVIVEQRRLQDYLHDGLGFVRHFHHLPDIRLDGFVVARAQRADVDHHVDFLGAVAQAMPVSATLDSVEVAPSGNPPRCKS